MDFANNAPPSHAVWFDVWAAGVALNTMCVKKGMVGVAGRIGKSNFCCADERQNRSYASCAILRSRLIFANR